MKISVKTRFNAAKQNIEKFGNNKYLMYLPFPEDEEAIGLLKEVLSKYLGVPVNRIDYAGQDFYKDKIFEVM